MQKKSPHFVRARTILLASLVAAGSLAGCGNTNLSDIEHIARAKDFQDKGDLTASVIELKGALKKNPDNAEARWLLGQIYIDLENGAAAEKELKRARELGVDQDSVLVPLGRALLQQNKAKQVLDEIQIPNNAPTTLRIGALTIRGEAHLDLQKTEAAQADLSAALEACGTSKCIDTLLALSSLELSSRNDAVKAREWLMKAIAQDPKNGKAWLRMGDLEQALNRLQEALDSYTKALQANPLDLRALTERAHMNLQLGKVKASKADLEKLRKLSPKYPAVQYLDGRHALLRKETAQAQALLEAFLKVNPSHPSATYYLAIAHAAQGHLQQANDLLAQLLDAYPGSTQTRTLLANVQAQRGAFNDAIKTLEPLAKQIPIDITVIKQLGRFYLRKGDLQTGVSYLQQAVAAQPDSAATRLDLGQVLEAQGKTDLALAQFDAALQIKPDLIEAEILRIFAHLSKQQFDAALQAVATFKTRHPKNPAPDALAASAYVGKKDYAKARQALEQSLALDSKYFPARIALARLALTQNDPATARRHYQDILKQDPAHLDSLLALATLEVRAGKPKESVAWLEKARQKHPKALAPALLLINAHLQNNEPLKALALARDARSEHPTDPGALQALARSQLATGETSSALASFRTLAGQLPKSAQIHHLLGMAYLQAQDAKAASTSFNKALKLDPTMLPAAVALSSLELQNGRTQEALRIARQIQQQQPTIPVGYELEGNAHGRAGAYANAVKAYAVAYEHGKSSRLAVQLARAQHQAGSASGAYQTLTHWLTTHPDDMIAHAALGSIYQVNGKLQEAAEQYQKIVVRQPNNAITLNDLGWIYYLQGDTRALEYAEKAYKAAPEQPAVLDTLGWILLQKGEVKRGLSFLQKAVDKTSGIPIVQYHYAVALDKAGRSPEARKTLETLLAKQEHFAEVQEARKLLKKLQSID